MAIKGLIGALLLAIGGTILFGLYIQLIDFGLFQWLHSSINSQILLYVFIFSGFFIFGLGLWLIVLSGKTQTKQNPSWKSL